MLQFLPPKIRLQDAELLPHDITLHGDTVKKQ